jgi:hypothetical protein
MKTMIISDITNNAESIIPYGLNFGKFTETEVEIIHILDPRAHHGVNSQIADSQSITPGEKLSHQEILQREKNQVDKALDVLLSKEASRLNYPLKIDVIIETDHLETGLGSRLRTNPGSILIASAKPDNSMISSLHELLSVARQLDAILIVVRPGQGFQKPKEALLLTDYSQHDQGQLRQVFAWLKPFDAIIYACAIVRMKHFVDMELKGKAWKQVVKNYLEPPSLLKTSLIKGEDHVKTLKDYVRRNGPDLVIVPRNMKKNDGYGFLSKSIAKELIESLTKPVLLY